jgi:MFS family permease
MQTFLIIWIGQVVSLFGSKLTEFALGFWILEQTYQETGTISQFALTILLIYLPKVIISPIAGVLIDRWNRRYAMILSDSVSGIITLVVMLLVFTGKLQVWHIYVAVTINSAFGAFQLPAYLAAIAQLVPKENFSRANGMVQASSGAAKIAAPFIAGLLMKVFGIEGVLFIDITTFVVALITLLAVKFPNHKRRNHKQTKIIEQLVNETLSAWNYITARASLLKLLSFIAISYFTTGMLEVVLWPLLYEPDSTTELGSVLSIGGCGMLLGSILMTVWNGPKYLVKTIIVFVGIQGIIVLLSGLKISILAMGIGIFCYLFSLPIIVSCNQTIWQRKIPPRLQGRVFALQQTVERSLAICAYLLAGPLVDRVLNPLMSEDGFLAHSIGKIIGTGLGQGIALLLVLLGLVNLVAAALAWQQPRLQKLEKELPDLGKSQFKFEQFDLTEHHNSEYHLHKSN